MQIISLSGFVTAALHNFFLCSHICQLLGLVAFESRHRRMSDLNKGARQSSRIISSDGKSAKKNPLESQSE